MKENSIYTLENLIDEQKKLDWDKKALMYGRVVNKHARNNLWYDITGHSPDYEEGKGRVIPYSKIPITKIIYDIMIQRKNILEIKQKI